MVQTCGNSSLIISNSEFVSSQVINWSFKNRRVRRKITAGAAYGSEIDLVRETFLKVAANTAILKTPKTECAV
ncbi:MAG: mechanosensitive ion channel [Desulfobacteraceae bacterium]|nr:mechanosensitive ion channel [Desulfobacteraceae bacterium]